MHSRFAALLLGLGIVDLGYVNLALGPEVFAIVGARGDAEAMLAEPDVVIHQSQPSAPAALPPTGLARAPAAPQTTAQTSAQLPSPAAAPAQMTMDVPPAPDDPAAAAEALGPEDAISEWTVKFPLTDMADLPEQANEMLTAMARLLQNEPELSISIVGHADARGTREHNLGLGGRRARAVAEALTRAGVSPVHLHVKSRGEDEPSAVGATEETWAENRRVEIAIVTPGSQAP
jgi:peptidoglycan-associated lipoprotein